MAFKAKLTFNGDPSLGSEISSWTGVCEEDGTRFFLCHKEASRILGLDPNKKYKVKVFRNKPKKWSTSVKILLEPVLDGHILYLKKRHVDVEVPDLLANWLVDNVYFGSKIKVKLWIKVKELDE